VNYSEKLWSPDSSGSCGVRQFLFLWGPTVPVPVESNSSGSCGVRQFRFLWSPAVPASLESESFGSFGIRQVRFLGGITVPVLAKSDSSGSCGVRQFQFLANFVHHTSCEICVVSPGTVVGIWKHIGTADMKIHCAVGI
jgi:hypothetical protein